MHPPHDVEIPAAQQFLESLKQQTRPQHEALERSAGPAVLMQPDLSLQRYLQILQRFYGFILPVEADIYPILNTVFQNIDRFKRGDLLVQDLVSLGMTEVAIAQLPRISALPLVKTTAEAFGVVYVLEGSKLGGQFICRKIAPELGLSPDRGLQFFNGHGRETGQVWQEFRQNMGHYAVTMQQQEAVISAAARTFEAIKTWLEFPFKHGS